jgi:hypothetical protein
MTYFNTQICKNIIPNKALEYTIKQLEKNKNNYNLSEDLIAGKTFNLNQAIYEQIKTFLPLLPNEHGHLHFSINDPATGLHSDKNYNYEYGDKLIQNFARTFIIPLFTQSTYTIVFNEALPKEVKQIEMHEYMKTLPVINKITLEDRKKFFEFDDNVLPITGRPDETCNNTWLEKLSIETIFPWVGGDVLIFDRNKIHTGDNYQKHGVPEKKGMIIWTSIHEV